MNALNETVHNPGTRLPSNMYARSLGGFYRVCGTGNYVRGRLVLLHN